MKGIAQKLLIGTSVLVGTIAASAPAFAANLTYVTTTGDINIFEPINSTQLQDLGNTDNTTAKNALLSAGNVELDNNIDYGWANQTASTLTANFDDNTSITFSSVGYADWFTNGLAATWYTAAYATYTSQFNTLAAMAGADATNTTAMIALLESQKVFQRLSDPNIAYVEGGGGEFSFGLAGHTNFATALGINNPLLASMIASEVVKYSLDGGTTWEYAYSLGEDSVLSGVVDVGDGTSYSRNFNFTVGEATETAGVPEPSTILGLMAIGGLVAASKRKSEKA